MPSQVEQRETTFAAQVSYLRGDLDPNAQALYRRLPRFESRLRDEPGQVSLDVGSAVLALDRHRLFGGRFEALRREAGQLARIVGVTDLIDTPYGSAARMIEGCYELIVHLTYNWPDRLERARQLFEEGIDPPYAQADLDSRWVAAHLRDIADDLGTASVWAHLPPSVPPAAAKAMTLGDPPVLSLWPPQLDLLSGTPNPLDPAVRRLVLSFPTSAGKTLIAQYIVAAHVASGAGPACVVVPTHSLGRELRRDLGRRLSTIAGQAEDAGPLGLPLPAQPSAVVMTPEKLAAHLRLEPNRMLGEYSLLVIDEAHALEALAAFEEVVRQGQDAIMQTVDGAAADFIGHVWFVANALSELKLATADPVRLSLESTLAWQQLDDWTRERWRTVGVLAVHRFEETSAEVRRRWARTGTSLPNAVLRQQVATQILAELWSLTDPRDPVTAFLLVSDSGRLGQLLSINETRAARFRPRRNAPRNTAFDVDLRALTADWLHGREVGEIGEAYLGAVTDETYRYEQLSEFIAQVLEHLLPWLLNTVVGWVNEDLEEDGQLCPELPAYIRFGVDTPIALELAQAGVRSRRLVHVVAAKAAAVKELPVREWLTETDIRIWRQLFDASPSELADLLVFSRARDARITSRVLAGEVVDCLSSSRARPLPEMSRFGRPRRIRRRGWPHSGTVRPWVTSGPRTTTT